MRSHLRHKNQNIHTYTQFQAYPSGLETQYLHSMNFFHRVGPHPLAESTASDFGLDFLYRYRIDHFLVAAGFSTYTATQ